MKKKLHRKLRQGALNTALCLFFSVRTLDARRWREA